MKKILMAEYLEYSSPFTVGSHHYAGEFALNGYEVLWLAPPYNFLYYFKDKELYEKRKTISGKKLFTEGKNIYTYAPLTSLLYMNHKPFDSKLAAKLSLKLTFPNLKSMLKGNGFQEVDILWLTNIKYFYLTKLVKFKKLVYRCSDDLSGFKYIPKTMLSLEETLIKNADKVFVTASDLIEKKSYLRKDLIYLPNGVNLDDFQKEIYEMPKEFLNNNRKRCIYVGAIDYWFDTELVKFCAEKLPNVDFYIIGPTKIDVSSLLGLKNIFLLGSKKYCELSNYLYYSNASIIPFKINKLTNSINPIKLYEYMSMGLNVVSTDLKEIKNLNSPALIAHDYEEFCKAIGEALENCDSKERNYEFARSNTWSCRFQNIIEELEII